MKTRTAYAFALVLLVGCAGPPDRPTRDPAEPGVPGSGLGKADGFEWGSDSSGSGTFEVEVAKGATVTLGTIPVDRESVEVKLGCPADLDFRLYDGTTKLIHWTQGILTGPTEVSATYQGMKITWSGYEGGNELIKIEGKTTSELTVKVYGYEAGTGTVTYSWGGGDSGGGGTTPETFDQRLAAFKQKYPTQVIVAEKQGKPAIFVDTKVCTTEAEATAFYADLYKMVGSSTAMLWNPAGDNYFHLAFGAGPATSLDSYFQMKAIRLYSCIHIWDASAGNLEEECYDDEEYDEDDYVDENLDACYDSDQVERERAVALVELDDAQLKSLNTYLEAIMDDFEATLGPADYYGGTPPYFGGSKHNCTSWFTTWINKEVSSKYPTSANPASFLQSVTTGGWSGTLPPGFQALLVFNHASPPQDGATIPKDFPLDFGH